MQRDAPGGGGLAARERRERIGNGSGRRTPCLFCGARDVSVLLDLGRQPVSTRFTTTPLSPVVTHELVLGVCSRCGILQLIRPFPYRDLVPLFDWIVYREPEDHLDAVADRIAALPNLDAAPCALGLTDKDRTTLARLEQRGFRRAAAIDPRSDLGAAWPNANIESVQALLTPEKARAIVASRGSVDLVVARHILEHAEDPTRLLRAVDALLAPGGHLVIEVPDCAGNLRRQDYTMIWEEHVAYFMHDTLGRALTPLGYDILGIDTHAYPFEDVLVMYARKPMHRTRAADGARIVDTGLALARRYAAAFEPWTRRYRGLFDRMNADGRRLAAYGAGHLTAAFINFHGLAEYFAFAVDDTPQKQGLFLPGSGCAIVGRDQLRADTISCCLLGLSPQTEGKVIANNAAFSAAGGSFASLLVDSPRSIRRHVAPPEE